jgi:hypothetical protein
MPAADRAAEQRPTGTVELIAGKLADRDDEISRGKYRDRREGHVVTFPPPPANTTPMTLR